MRGGLAVVDVDTRFTYVNNRFCELLGYSHEELIGTSAYSYVDFMGTQILDSQLEGRRQGESSSYEVVIRHKAGKEVPMLVSGSPLFGMNREYAGSVAVWIDITALKQAEEALRQALAKEKELSELKTRFVSMASHEFRTPLATILAVTESLTVYRHKLTEEQIQKKLGNIHKQVDHLKDIMEDVLLLARMQARRVEFNPVKVNLHALCQEVIQDFQSRPDIHHQFDYSCNHENLNLMLDIKLIRQIISNLLSNAIKYSTPDQPVQLTLQYEAQSCVLVVHDHGIGIPEADLKHLFEPFHRASNVGTISGTGLGLVIVKDSIELHGGTISVESQVGDGSTFTIRLPMSDRGDQNNDENPDY